MPCLTARLLRFVLAAAAVEWNRDLIVPAFGNNPFGGLINRTGLEKKTAP